MATKRSRFVRQTTITTALLLAAQVVGTIPAHAQAPAHGITAGEGMLPPDLASSTRFHDPEIARVVNGHLASMGRGYSACNARRYRDDRSRLDGFQAVLEEMRDRWSRGEVNTRTAQIQRLIESGESRIGAEILASPSGPGDAISGDTQKLSEDIAALRRLADALPARLPDPCPPERDAYRGLIQVFGSIGAIDGLGISNGGMGGKQDVTVFGGGIGATVPVGDNALTFTLHGLTGDATSPAARTGVDSLGRTFVQFDGQTQLVPAGLDVTGAIMRSDYQEIGGSIIWNPSRDIRRRGWFYDRFRAMPRIPDRAASESTFGAEFGPEHAFIPSFHAGVTDIRHDERLRVDYGGIGFFIDERRAVDTTRLNAGLGLDLGLLDPNSSRAFVRMAARAQANLDLVDGEGSYRTAQTNVFDETVAVDLSRTAITFSFSAEAEAGVEIAEGVTIFVSGSAGRIPIWSIVPREGEQARLESDMHWSFLGSIGIAAGF